MCACEGREHRSSPCWKCRTDAATDKAVAAIERMTPETARLVRDTMRDAAPELWPARFEGDDN